VDLAALLAYSTNRTWPITRQHTGHAITLNVPPTIRGESHFLSPLSKALVFFLIDTSRSMTFDTNHYDSRRYHYRSSRHDRTDYLLVGDGKIPHKSRSSRSLRVSDEASPRRHRSRSSRRRWPPPPTVEDEEEALASEYPSQSSKKDSDSESRGTIDQEPVIIELLNLERRFVLTADPVPIVKSRSRNEALKLEMRGRKANISDSEEKAPLKVETNEHVLFDRRKPSPYSFSRTPITRMTTGDILLSPDSILPQASPGVPRSIPRESTLGPRSEKKSSSGDSEANYNSRSEISEESDIDPRDTRKKRSSHIDRTARNSTANPRTRESQQSGVNFSDTDSDERKRVPREQSRNNLQSSSHFGSSPADRSDNPIASILNPRKVIPSSSKNTRSESQYGSSPKRDVPHHISIPGAEPPSARFSQPSTANSPKATGFQEAGSVPPTPQSTFEHIPFELPGDRVPTPYNQPPSVAPKQPSKLSSSVPPPSMNQGPPPRSVPNQMNNRKSATDPTSGGALPYPDNDMFVAMPAAQSFLRTDSYGQPAESVPMSRNSSTQSNTSSNAQRRNRAGSINSLIRSSKTDIPPPAPPILQEAAHHGCATSSGSELPPISLPSCPRRKLSNKYDDWWSLEGYPDFDVCPHCLNDIIRPTQFRRLLVPARRRPNAYIRCDFGSPWIRLAWLLTLKQKRDDFDLIYKLAGLWEVEPRCPDEYATTPFWWGLVDKDLYYIPNFNVCSRDKANIEILFPSLKGAFTRNTATPRQGQQCSMRADGRRFPLYLNTIDMIHDKAVGSYVHRAATSSSFDLLPRKLTGSADTRPFIELAARLANKPECPRDNLSKDGLWHYIADCPDLTVCPECYDAVIRPDLKDAPAIATLFTRTPQSLDPFTIGSSSVARLGNSAGLTCQLYSSRMQKAWDRAVEDDDVEYLVRKMRERRTMEIQLRRQKADLVRMLKRGSAEFHLGGGVDREMLKRDLARIDKEWQDYE
jgi:hypothetical protein